MNNLKISTDDVMDKMHEHLINQGYTKDMYSFDYVKNIGYGIVTRVTYSDFLRACDVQRGCIIINGGDDNEKLY